MTNEELKIVLIILGTIPALWQLTLFVMGAAIVASGNNAKVGLMPGYIAAAFFIAAVLI